ncbi:unannotated protein [freshwater metagenome]|uniref:Unannotated protein n=1 Tax=freshwater metagenome TaxID=449393 RepID=A0A6J7EBU9_9ZZZZ|nr:hypothetical protein [Actinomycetota bacterium]
MPSRRTPFALPFSDEVPALAVLVRGGELGDEPPARLGEAAAEHNVAGFVLQAAAEGRLRLPPAEQRALADRHLRRVAATALRRRALGPIVDALAPACGAAPVLIKGPALADRTYPDWRLRPYGDLDLMVPRDRLGEATQALVQEGYTLIEEFRPGYAERFGHDLHVRRGDGAAAVDVELHWRIGDDRVGEPLSHGHLIREALTLDVDGTPVLIPGTADQLLLAAVHLLSDRARRLCWVNDVRLLAQTAPEHQWTATFARAEALGGGLLWVLHRALDYAAHHLGLERARPLPAGVRPPYGPLRAVEELDLQASPHIGRLVALHGLDRLRYLRAVAIPTRAGLEGTVGGDGAGLHTLVWRHLTGAVRGVRRPRG